LKFHDVIIAGRPTTIVYRRKYALREGHEILFRYCGSKKFLRGRIARIIAGVPVIETI
jgi:hypothetical protein